MDDIPVEVEEIEEEAFEQKDPIPTIILKNSPTPTQASAKQSSAPKVTTAPAAVTPQSPTPTAVDPLAGKCIIYVSGIRYNITEFRNIHGGGDIFQCGTDMTDNFMSEHPESYLGQMARYKI